MEASRLRYLFQRQGEGNLSVEERMELLQFLAARENEPEVKEWIAQNYAAAGAAERTMKEESAHAILRLILNTNKKEATIITMRPARRWYRVGIAAVFILAIGAAGIFYFSNKANKNSATAPSLVAKDVKAPTRYKATITLSDGRKIDLDRAENGVLAQQEGVTVVKDNGEISYQPSAVSNQPIQYNTLSNPRGSKVVPLVLADGSRVWLNNESSIKYPIAFNGKERRVEITGEAYFEVAHDASKPFHVALLRQAQDDKPVDVQVLGTHFNVNAYDDEEAIKVTLLEGSVKVTLHFGKLSAGSDKGDKETTIKPGQQASIAEDIKVADNVDLDRVMAWKNDRFIFSGDNIQSIMRQLARWYDVNVNYVGTIPSDEFVGVITRSRNENISTILHTLEQTGTVHFTISGKTVTVKR